VFSALIPIARARSGFTRVALIRRPSALYLSIAARSAVMTIAVAACHTSKLMKIVSHTSYGFFSGPTYCCDASV
jgi:hypothetical protein